MTALRLVQLGLILASAWTGAEAFAAGGRPPFDPSRAISEDRLGFETLKAAMVRHGTKSVEETLALLPVSYRSRYALVYASASVQESSLDFPRVILYGKDARFTLTFSGLEGTEGYDSIEMIEYLPSTQDFEFRVIHFPSAKNTLRQPQFSERNPALCLECHQQPDPRPNWRGFPVWPNVYGSLGDRMVRGTREHDAFRTFVRGAGGHPRYGYLEGLEQREKDGVAPDGSRRSVAQLNGSPNQTLHELFREKNYRRIVRLIRESPHYSEYKFAILGALLRNCGPIEQFLPPPVQAMHEGTPAQWREKTEKDARFLLQFMTEIRSDAVGEVPRPFQSFLQADRFVSSYGAGAVGDLRYLFEGRDLSMDSWSMGPEYGVYDFRDEDSGILGLRRYLEVSDSDLGSALGCQKLQEKSLTAMDAYSLSIQSTTRSPGSTRVKKKNNPGRPGLGFLGKEKERDSLGEREARIGLEQLLQKAS